MLEQRKLSDGPVSLHQESSFGVSWLAELTFHEVRLHHL